MPCNTADLARLSAIVSEKQADAICAKYNLNTMTVEQAVLSYLAAHTVSVAEGTDATFLLFSGYLVFIMQAGFAMLCAGCVRTKNSTNILLKNMADACVGGLCYYLLGYAFAYGVGDGANGFIGSGNYALSNTINGEELLAWQNFFFQWAFSAAAATIVSGAVAERITFSAYLGYTSLMTTFVYPVVSHWVWSSVGWLSAANLNPVGGSGAIDYSGSGVVHLVGGTASLMGIWALGPRLGRFDAQGKVNKRDFLNPEAVLYTTLGTFLLWFGWYGFNPGSALTITGPERSTLVARTAVITTLGGSAGACTALFISWFMNDREWDLTQLCNGALCGLVAVTAGCGVIQPYGAITLGILAAPTFMAVETLLWRLQLDDVVAAVSMHGACGLLGVLGVGFFATPQYVDQVFPGSSSNRYGVFYGGTGDLLGCQVLLCVVIIGWVGTFFGIYFFGARSLGFLRVIPEQELAGLDASKYGVITTNELPMAAQIAMRDNPSATSGTAPWDGQKWSGVNA